MKVKHLDMEVKTLERFFKKIEKLKTGIAQKDNEILFRELSDFFPLKIEKFPSGLKHNGWIVPKHWEVEKAEIWEKDKLVFDGTQHHLAIGGSSTSYTGVLDKSELSEHVNLLEKYPECYVYNPLNNLRPWQKGFSFSIPYNIWKTFGNGPFKIDLKTKFINHEMHVATCFHKGKSNETIVFNAHTCHPMQLNDGLSGVLLILRLFQWLSRKETKYSYLGVIAPEHLGTVFYLSKKTDSWLSNIKHALFLESLASTGPLKVQSSFDNRSITNRFIIKAVSDLQNNCEIYPYRTLIGNDESVWEAGGIGVSTATLTRHPFEYYHTQFDNAKSFDMEKFFEAEKVLHNYVDIHENDCFVKRNFKGLVALSNPINDLYKTPPNITIHNNFDNNHLRWVRFQDAIFQLLEGENTIFNISEATDISFKEVNEYITKFYEKGLLYKKEICSTDVYKSVAKLELHSFNNL